MSGKAEMNTEQLREWDRQIATKVFGMTVRPWPGVTPPLYLQYIPPEDRTFTFNLVPRYSTDPIASKKLREKLAERFDSIELRWDRSARDGGILENPWMCRVACDVRVRGVGSNAVWTFVAVAADECQAVVICALRSVGIEVEP